MIDDGRPIFIQIAEDIETQIVEGALTEESRAPSTNELATFFRINPATAGKGLQQLAAEGILYKKRGIGMFVAPGARTAIVGKRQAAFVEDYVAPLLAEARKIGIDAAQLMELIQRGESS